MIQELLSKPVEPARRLFPAAADRVAWRAAAVSPRTKRLQQDVLLEAEELLDASIPELRATAFMRFVRDGNRFEYEESYFARRRQLCVLVLAEALEYRGRFLDALIDRLWAIVTEPFWTLPAHVPVRNFTTSTGEEMRDPLPMDEYEIIDLFSAETAMTVTLTLELFEPELRALSPNLAARCRRVLYERCVRPFDGGGVPFWWRTGENNWTPWVVSNLLEPIRFLLSGTEPERCLDLLRRLCGCADAFLSHYPVDGVCDEGPGYWMVSPLRLFWILEELCCMAGEGAVARVFRDEKIRRMGEFIVDSHLCGDYYAAFSDSPVSQKLQPDAAIYRFGERLGSERLMHFANRGAECASFGSIVALSNVLAAVFWLPCEPYALPEEESVSWYPASEQLFVKTGGVAFAAKGGHNGEGHNHNDVGSFLFFLRGEPLLVDIGRTEYTKFTFSEHRYENWQLTSLAHNLPSIDGVGQGAGTEFAAREMKFADDGERIRLELDLAGAYPAAASLEQLIRVFEFDRKSGVLAVSDRWRASRAVTLESRFFTPATVKFDGFRTAQLKRNNVSLRAELRAPEAVRLTLGKRQLVDCFARRSWGDAIVELVVNGAGSAGEYRMRFEPER